MPTLRRWLLIGVVIAVLAPAARAAGDDAEEKTDESAKTITTASGIALIGACLGAAACVVGGGFAIARIGSACIEAIARQPEAAGAMFAPMIVAAAMIEGGMLFAIVVCLVGMMKL